MIQGVVFVERGRVSHTFMRDDNDDLYIVDMDGLVDGECPVCYGVLDFTAVCGNCGVNWNDPDECEIANKLLWEKGVE
jgi:hypothetical protein